MSEDSERMVEWQKQVAPREVPAPVDLPGSPTSPNLHRKPMDDVSEGPKDIPMVEPVEKSPYGADPTPYGEEEPDEEVAPEEMENPVETEERRRRRDK